jgi:hypothetical protein
VRRGWWNVSAKQPSRPTPRAWRALVRRTKEDPEYRPDSLVDIEHRVVEDDGTTWIARGLADHIGDFERRDGAPTVS